MSDDLTPVNTPPQSSASAWVAVVGGGPAGLMAAEVLAHAGVRVEVFDAMASVGRKFLLAGRGGLNLTHSEPLAPFVSRYAERAEAVSPWLDAFGPQAVRDWAAGLGVDTFVGSSGRVFPADMKAAPLLRAWLHRLRAMGVVVHARHRWQGWTTEGALRFIAPVGEVVVQPTAVVLALGGGSWARLGSDGAWVPWLQARGVDVVRLQATNCGFDVGHGEQPGWSDYLRSRFAGQPIKPVAASVALPDGSVRRQQGEFVLTESGVEGSLVYAFSALLREQINQTGQARFVLDLLPNHTFEQVFAEVRRPRGPRSLATHLKSRLGIAGLKLALLHELLSPADLDDAANLAKALKGLPVTLTATRPMDEAISTAGGVRLEALDDGLMLQACPGVFCAGEMLDWEAPTGGYLLTASLASGRVAGQGVLRWLRQQAAVPRP